MMKQFGTKIFSTMMSSGGYIERLKEKAHRDITGDKKAQGVIEYGMLIAVIIGLVVFIAGLKDKIAGKLNQAGSMIDGLPVGNSK